jgi:hypothetical protein
MKEDAYLSISILPDDSNVRISLRDLALAQWNSLEVHFFGLTAAQVDRLGEHYQICKEVALHLLAIVQSSQLLFALQLSFRVNKVLQRQ